MAEQGERLAVVEAKMLAYHESEMSLISNNQTTVVTMMEKHQADDNRVTDQFFKMHDQHYKKEGELERAVTELSAQVQAVDRHVKAADRTLGDHIVAVQKTFKDLDDSKWKWATFLMAVITVLSNIIMYMRK